MTDERNKFTFGEDGNLAIKASAGTGKTFRLAMRFIALLFCDPKLDPLQIVAITFTRKAAAEILDKIIEQLLTLSRPDHQAALEKLKIDNLLPPEFTREAIPGILRRILLARELQVSTIDSFFVKIIQAFAAEFGLAGAVEMIDESRDASEKETVAELIRRTAAELPELLQEYAQGKEVRNFTSTLKDFLADTYAVYLLYPEEALWGNLPEPDFELSHAERERILQSLAVEVSRYDLQSAAGRDAAKKIREIMDAARTGKIGNLKKPVQILTAPDGNLYVKRGNTKDPLKLASVSAEMVRDLETLSLHVAVTQLRWKIRKSKAACRILRLYDALHAANTRNAGRLTFRDLPNVIGALNPEVKLDLEYRLDTRNLHYMLDEFQDTSTQQWSFMNNLMSEAAGTDHTFFMVGDVKQSLYQWRFGNPKLFDAVCGAFGIHAVSLDESRRSVPAILDAVNQTFLSDKITDDLTRDAIGRMQFRKHLPCQDKLGLPGYAELRQGSKSKETEARAAERSAELCTLLADLLARDFSVALLLRTNREVEAYKQALRALAPALPMTTEGAIYPGESMACTLLTLLLRLAAHPGDPLARRALPLFAWEASAAFTAAEIAHALHLTGGKDWETLADNLRILLAETGFAGFVAQFQAAYESRLSEFDRDRLAVAAQQAVDFSGSVEEYLASLEKAQGVGVSVKRTVQIMTIHKSKGLDFDVVILPELGSAASRGGAKLVIAPMEANLEAQQGSEQLDALKPAFISFLPGEFAECCLPEIRQIKDKIQRDEIYEKTCGLYVAMTRAKRALYLYADEDCWKSASKFRADRLLVQALCDHRPEPGESVLYSAGERDWYRRREATGDGTMAEAAAIVALDALTAKRPVVPLWNAPSRHAEKADNVSAIRPEHRFDGGRSAELGTRIHAVFEQVEYLDSVNPEKLRAALGCDELAPQARAIWEKATAPGGEIARVLQRPEEPRELWRERDFLLCDADGNRLSGCFDRVEIVRDASGRAQRASIYDYKSDALEAPEEFLERHREQLNAYRKACAQLLALPETQVECFILALRPNRVIGVAG